jgi:hypothetical protein
MLIRESLIKNRLATHFSSKRLKVFDEVPFLDKRIDVLGYSRKNRKFVAVEAKIANWQKALEQALTYRLVANEVYVALWHENVKRMDLRHFSDFGIGVLDVNCKVRTLLDPVESSIIHRSLREKLELYLQGREVEVG